MPIRNRSVMGGTSIQATPEEESNRRAQEMYINAATQKYLADSQSNASRYGVDANIGMNRDNLASQRELNGTFNQKATADFGMERLRGDNLVANTRAGNEPTMAGHALDQLKYNDISPSIKAKSIAEKDKIEMTNTWIKNYLKQGAGPAAAGGAAVGGGLDQSEMALMMFGANPADIMKSRSDRGQRDRDREQDGEAVRTKLATALAAAGNHTAAAALLKGTNGFKDMTDEALAGAMQRQIDPADVEGILAQKLPDFINRDTDSAWSRSVKFGVPGALSAKGDPSAQESGDIQELYNQLVEAYTAKNGGRKSLAIQQAKAKMAEFAKTSGQGDDFLTDWDGDKTKMLFRGF